MKKLEIINAIISSLKTPEGGYETFPIIETVPPKYRVNGRFKFMIADNISVSEYGGEAKLVMCYKSVRWKFPELKKEIYENILNSIEESRKPRVYIIMKDEAHDYYKSIDNVFMTTDKEKALKEFEKYRDDVRKYADENGFVFEDGDRFAEGYEDGYEDRNYYGVTLFEKYLD